MNVLVVVVFFIKSQWNTLVRSGSSKMYRQNYLICSWVEWISFAWISLGFISLSLSLSFSGSKIFLCTWTTFLWRNSMGTVGKMIGTHKKLLIIIIIQQYMWFPIWYISWTEKNLNDIFYSHFRWTSCIALTEKFGQCHQ